MAILDHDAVAPSSIDDVSVAQIGSLPAYVGTNESGQWDWKPNPNLYVAPVLQGVHTAETPDPVYFPFSESPTNAEVAAYFVANEISEETIVVTKPQPAGTGILHHFQIYSDGGTTKARYDGEEKPIPLTDLPNQNDYRIGDPIVIDSGADAGRWYINPVGVWQRSETGTGSGLSGSQPTDDRPIWIISDEATRNGVLGIFPDMRVWSVSEDSREQYDGTTWTAVTEGWGEQDEYVYIDGDLPDSGNSGSAREFLVNKGIRGVRLTKGTVEG